MWEYLARKIGPRHLRGETTDLHPPAPTGEVGKADVIKPHEVKGGEHRSTAAQSREGTGHHAGRELKCPVCHEVMKIRYIGKIQVDQCPVCEGVFLDGGELKALQVENSSYEHGDTEDHFLIYTPHGLSKKIIDHGQS